MTDKHDQHYRNLDVRGIEPIKAMESAVCNGLPESLHPVARRNLNIAQAVRYLLRAGEKEGQSASKDLDKAANYVHRARTGSWMPDAVGSVSEELEDLRRWKKEASIVFDGIPFQEIGKEIGVRWGDSVGSAILPWIREAKDRIKELESA